MVLETHRTLQALLEGIEVLGVAGELATPIGGLSQNSREIGRGDLFVAVRGTQLDGHRFIADAFQRGAAAVVGEIAPANGMPATYVQVRDSRLALASLAANYYEHPSRSMTLIGVTGTNGKTTTTLLIERVLQHDGRSVGVLGTLQYRWANKILAAPMTTPDSLELQRLFHEMRRDSVSHVVMEVSSHALALGRVIGCAFAAGVFTNLSQDHLDFHHSMEDYFQAKALLFRNYLADKQLGVAVINRDDAYGSRLLEEITDAWSYSLERHDARVWVRSAELTTAGIQAELVTPLGPLTVRSALMGRLNLQNILAAATTALALGVSPRAVVDGLAAVREVDGRLQRVPVPQSLGWEVVVDYAHTPDAMEKSLSCLREVTQGRLVAVFGCGGDRDRGKRPLMGGVAARLADLVILTSDNPRSEVPEEIIAEIEPGVRAAGVKRFEPATGAGVRRGYAIEADRRSAIRLALQLARRGDLVFIGGKGHETYQIVQGKKSPFDDRLVVQEFLSVLQPSTR